MKAADILIYLDRFLNNLDTNTSAMLDTAFDNIADARMSVFRSNSNWIIIFEFVFCEKITGEAHVLIFGYGDAIREQGPLFQFVRFPFDWPGDNSLENLMFPNGEWKLDRAHFSILRDGQLIKFTPGIEDYALAGIQFDEWRTGPNTLTPIELLRYVCYELRHPFFSSEDHLRYVIDACRVENDHPLSHQMILLLQTREWRHPYGAEKPSELECFQILARAIETGDLTEWSNQDRSAFNTHWSFWDEIIEAAYGDTENPYQLVGVQERKIKEHPGNSGELTPPGG